jgi:hypothetical protein
MLKLSVRPSVIFTNCISRQRQQDASIIILVVITSRVEMVQCSWLCPIEPTCYVNFESQAAIVVPMLLALILGQGILFNST